MAEPDFAGILSQLGGGPTEAEKRDAQRWALMHAGLGILAANKGGPYPQPLGGILGQGGLQGLGAYQGQLNQNVSDRKAGGLAALQAMQIRKQIEQMAALAKFDNTGGAGPQGAPQVAGAPAGPTPAGMSAGTSTAAFGVPDYMTKDVPPPPTPSGPRVPDYGQLIKGGVPPAAVNALMEEWKLRNPKGENIPGVGLVNPHTGGVTASFPRITETGRAAGLVPDGQGGFRVQVPQGSLEAYTGFQNADEAAKARMDPFMGQVDPTGRPIPQTRLQFAQRISPEARAATGDASSPAGMGPTPTQASAAGAVGKGDAERVMALEQKLPSLAATLRRLDRMESLTGDATFAASGAETKALLGSIAQAFGLQIDKAKTANTEEYIAHVSELLKERLGSKDYGSGVAVSNLDTLTATKPLPELVKTEQGRMQIIQAIRSDTVRSMKDATSARDYFNKNMSLRGFKYPSEDESPKSPAQRTIETPPRVRKFNPATGRIE